MQRDHIGIYTPESSTKCRPPNSKKQWQFHFGYLLVYIDPVFISSPKTPSGDAGCRRSIVNKWALTTTCHSFTHLPSPQSKIHTVLLQTTETNRIVLLLPHPSFPCPCLCFQSRFLHPESHASRPKKWAMAALRR